MGRLLTTLLLACTLCAAAPCAAWADDTQASDSNKVYANQMPDNSFLYETSIAELASADSFYDGQTVLITGEAVGDAINDEYDANKCWITLQETGDVDNPSVASVVMAKDQASMIDSFGRYGQTGATLQVRGTYHLDCSDHQGESDIHADEVSVVAQGSAVEHEVNPFQILGAVAVVLVGVGLTVGYLYLRDRAR